MNLVTEYYGPPLPPVICVVPLRTMETLCGVSYHTLYSANESNRLEIQREDTIGGERLFVDVGEMVLYMCHEAPEEVRWPETWLRVQDIIACEALYQPRLKRNKQTVREIAKSVKAGKPLDPIFVVRNRDNTFSLLDGHRRLQGTILAGKDEIRAIIVPLPSEYGRGIAERINSRQPENLPDGDKLPRVIEHLRANPTDIKQLKARQLNAADYAEALDCSGPTLSRALSLIAPSKAPDEVNLREVLEATVSYLGQQDLAGATRLDLEVMATLIAQATTKAMESKTANRSSIRAHILNRASPASRCAPSLLLQLYDRRGGDRRRVS